MTVYTEYTSADPLHYRIQVGSGGFIAKRNECAPGSDGDASASMECHFADCKATFPNESARRRHHQSSHTGDTPWQCDVPSCAARFAVKRALTAHKAAEHSSKKVEKAPPPLGDLERTTVLDEGETSEQMQGEKNADAEEIAKNCAYLATQLHAARVGSLVGAEREPYRAPE